MEYKEFKACITCGTYVPLQSIIKGLYCSPECAIAYKQCPTCNKHFPYTSEESEFCSEECSIIYSHRLPDYLKE